MIPSANSTGDLTWHVAAPDSWADHQGAAPAGAYSNTNSTAAVADSRYLNLHRHQILDWENAMLLAHHSHNHDSVYDHVADYTKPAAVNLQADSIASLSHPRHYENLLSAHMASNPSSFSTNQNTWGLLNTVCSRSSGGLEQEASLLQAASAPTYSYDSLNGADGLGGYGSLAAAGGLYNVDPLRSGNSTSHAGMLGLTSFDQRRLDDIVKRELYTTHDFNSRLGLNLGGRTYFSADDFAFGRWGKRLRPNSPGCIMQPAPLCQAEGCKADLSMAKHYHRRHKVCEYHSKAATVHIGDQTQRFCQQCSRFHVLAEFDDGKRSCRKRLADHNRRRRKPQPAPTLATEGAAEAKEHSQEAATGSESLQNGSKGSPLQAAEDQGITASTSTPGISSMGNNNEASSKKGGRAHADQSEQGKVERSEPASKASATPSKVQLKPGVANNMTMASTGTNQMAASLSLGATDILDVKPAASIPPHPGAECHDGGCFGTAPNANKHTVVMPWLQGSKKHQNLQGFPYNNSTISDQNVNDQGTDPPPYDKVASTSIQRPKSILSTTDQDDNNRSSWMMKEMTGGAQSEKDAMLAGSRQAGGSQPADEGGGHDLLRLLCDERGNKHTAMQANPSSVGTLAFLDRPLDPSTTSYTRAEHHHRMLHFSSLQQSDHGHHQVANSLNRSSSSNIAFGNHNHMI